MWLPNCDSTVDLHYEEPLRHVALIQTQMIFFLERETKQAINLGLLSCVAKLATSREREREREYAQRRSKSGVSAKPTYPYLAKSDG